MDKNNQMYNAIIEILKAELIPAMGCTEPIAVAYCAALARDTLGKIPENVEIDVSGSILKNVKSVIVPNTGHLKGIDAAAAAGIVVGNAKNVLEVLANVKEDEVYKITDYMKKTSMTVKHIDYGEVFDIVVKVSSGNDTAEVRIAKDHTNVVMIKKNDKLIKGETIESSLERMKKEGAETNKTKIDDYKKMLTMKDIIDFADTCDINDVKEIIERQIKYNYAIALEGIKNSYGSNIGKIILSEHKDDENTKLKAMAAAGSDARMNGCEMPVIINSGSGNQGITVSVPLIQYAKDNNVSEEKLIRGLIVSNLVSIHEKYSIGTLSAFCGAITAGAAAGAGLAYLEGGKIDEISETVANALGIVSGVICDGAKASCAGKIATAVEAGILGRQMYKTNNSFKGGDGIVCDTIEKTIDSVGMIGRDGMKGTNDEIIDIMINNKAKNQ